MPVYTIKNAKTGKSYDMQWDKPEPPTAYDMAKYADDQEVAYPTIAQKVDKIRQKPLTDYLPESMRPSTLSDKYIKPITDEGMAHPDTIMGKLKMYGGAFGESLAGQAEGMTRPDMLAIMAATGGAGKVAGVGYGKLATAMGAPGRLLAGKMGVEGLKEAYDSPDWTGRVTGGTKALLGGLGAAYNPAGRGAVEKDIADSPFGPSYEQTGVQPSPRRPPPPPPRPNWKEGEIIQDRLPEASYTPGPTPRQPLRLTSEAGPGQAPQPPEAPPMSSVAPPGLPPKRPVYYGGPSGGSISTNINEVPTRTFASDPGMNRRTMYPGKVRPQIDSRPAGLREMSPPGSNMRDVLEQNSPYNRIMRTEGGAQESPHGLQSPQTGSQVDPRPAESASPVVSDKSALSDTVVEFLAKRGDKAARQEALKRPSLRDRFQDETGAIGDIPKIRAARKSFVDTSTNFKTWAKETLAMGYSQDEINAAKRTADHFGEDITRSNDLHDFNHYMDGKYGDYYNDVAAAATEFKPLPKPPVGYQDTVNSYADEVGSPHPVLPKHFEETSRRVDKNQTAAARFAKLFGLPNDDQMLADMSGRQPAYKPEPLEAPAQKMPLRQKISKVEMKLRGLADIGDQEGALKIFKPKTSEEIAAKELKSTNHSKAKDWSTQRNAATTHGRYAAEDFADLRSGGVDLIKKFMSGDRSGRLADVQKWRDDLYAEEKAAGLGMGKSKQDWMNATIKPQFVGKGGASLPKDLKTPGTYEEGAAGGLTPRFDNLADIIGDRTRRSKLAIANKKFDNYLETTGQKRPKSIDPQGNLLYDSVNNKNIDSLTGSQQSRLENYIHDVHGKANRHWKLTGDIASKTKNLNLAGGIPGTPLNMHGSNIGRSMFQVMGKEGIANFAKGVANPKWLDSERVRLRPLVKEAIDYGYQTTSGEGAPLDALTEWLSKYKVGRALAKGMAWEEKWFEDPLFKRALPAWKDQVLEDRVRSITKREPKLSREEVLRKASDQANDFMGGQNTTLRNKTMKSSLQTFALAPDWAESQIKRAYKGYKAFVGKEDPIYRDAMLRSGGIRAAGGAIQAGSDEKRGEHSTDLTTVGLGQTSSGRYREVPLYGTASEGLRFPEEILRSGAGGDWSALGHVVKNRMSQPAQSFINSIYSQDAYGNPMTGKDKYDNPIPMGTSLMNYIDEMSKSLQPQQFQALMGLGRGKIGPEEALMQSIEAPLKYSAPPKPAVRGRARSRHR